MAAITEPIMLDSTGKEIIEAIRTKNIATTTKVGGVKPDGETVKVKEDGTLYSDWQKAQDFYGGKNLIDLRWAYSYTANGVTRVVDADEGTITFNGTSGSNNAEVLISRIKVKPNTSYTLSGAAPDSTPQTRDIRCYEYDANGTFLNSHFDNGNGNTFVTKENVNRIDVYYYFAENKTLSNLIIKPMLRLSDTSDEFVPFTPDNHLIANRFPNLPPIILANTGVDLTPRLNTTLYDEISKGDWRNIRPGDIIMGPTTGVGYLVAHRDYFYGYARVGLQSTHHLILIPRSALMSGKMNDTATTSGGYYNSKGRASVDILIQNYFIKDFGDHIKKFSNTEVNAIDGSKPSAWEWYDRYGDLLTEANVYGHSCIDTLMYGMNTQVQKEQFEIFRDLGVHVFVGNTWLKNVIDAGGFASIYNTGFINSIAANEEFNFMPFAVLAK